MKSLLLPVLAITLTAPAFARGGNDSVLTRGSQAWFAAETAEHELRGLVLTGALDEAAPTALVVDLTTTSTADVLIETAGGQVTDTCRMVDHWSRRGTVLKKEVLCNAFATEPRNDLTRGSNAWALVEAVERSLRQAVTANAEIKDGISFAESDLDGANLVQVKIGLTSGAELGFVCQRLATSRSGSARADLNCSAL